MEPSSVAALEDARAFTRSRVILTAGELDLFTFLGDNPSTAQEIADIFELDLRAATRLLDALVALELLRKHDSRYSPTPKGAPLSAHHPETVLPMVQHLLHLWDSWSHLTETVRRGVNPYRKPISESGTDNQKAFIRAMHVAGRDLSREIARSYDLSPFRKLLDVGGASGTYTIAFLRENPSMRAVIFDLESVLPLAEERLQQEGLRDRVELAAGDFYRDPLPRGCDLVLLSAIIHQNSPEENFELYRKVFEALEPEGTILIRDHIMEQDRSRPPAGALFALNMLVNTAGGDTYTFREIKESLERAGFTKVRLARSGERMDGLVEARKPVDRAAA